MPKDDLVYVGHMLDTARKALGKIRGKDRSEYDRDENLRLAVTHLIQIIGEAASGCRPSSVRHMRKSLGQTSSACAMW
jgi:uncharacterized protein with HEPN domain